MSRRIGVKLTSSFMAFMNSSRHVNSGDNRMRIQLSVKLKAMDELHIFDGKNIVQISRSPMFSKPFGMTINFDL